MKDFRRCTIGHRRNELAADVLGAAGDVGSAAEFLQLHGRLDQLYATPFNRAAHNAVTRVEGDASDLFWKAPDLAPAGGGDVVVENKVEAVINRATRQARERRHIDFVVVAKAAGEELADSDEHGAVLVRDQRRRYQLAQHFGVGAKDHQQLFGVAVLVRRAAVEL